MTHITITGASGFVGTSLISYLPSDGYHINSLSLRGNNKIEIHQGTNSVIHLAGKAHDTKKALNPDVYYGGNYELSKYLFDAFINSSAQKFIFISSVKASADQVSDILKEIDIPNPQTHYGKSKLMAEEYIQNQSLPAGKTYYILRPCMIHGPSNKGNLNLLFNIAKKGIPWPLGAYENKRSFCSIDNICFVIQELIENENIPSGVYNIADDDPLSTNELIRLIAESQGKKCHIWHFPKNIITLLAKLGDFIKLPLNTERLNKLTESYVVSNSKIKQAINKSLPVLSKVGLLKTFKSFNNNI